MSLPPPLLVFSFILGAVIGSFLNVCIYRIPAGFSVVSPGSRCPQCEAAIRWYQNIPILSWIFLRGRCAKCRVPISVRYPLVEALTGGLFALVLWKFGLHGVTPVYWLMTASLIVITFIDLDHQIIPDVISLPGIVVGFVCSFAVPWMSWTDSLLGILIGGGSLLLVAVVYEFLTKKEGMGGGDIKLLAMIGAFLGWQAVFPVIFISSLVGTAVGIPVMIRQKADARLAMPFGPFLAFGALFYLLWGPELIRWYLRLFVPEGG
ncbi:prepilin peptidase [Geoalkalibacter sp.]|uniref:prepilin peptidase n=1 Tax=Geoalkalibacter sp. TaxID=3041440 RepID=UPI00272E1332|nr:A24 family peptidase [Geoalkalibacter sp.]